jgi:hypothetical protein
MGFAYGDRYVGCERRVVRGRNQNCKRIRLHERHGIGVLTNSKVFWDVHG